MMTKMWFLCPTLSPLMILVLRKPTMRGSYGRPFCKKGTQRELGHVAMYHLWVLEAPMEGRKKSSVLGVERDKASRGETRQEFSVSESSNQIVAISNGTEDGAVIGGSLADGSTSEVLPGQDDAGQGTILESTEQISGEETGQQVGEERSNVLQSDSSEKCT